MYRERINKKSIESSFLRSFITCILGPRRVGKSLFVSHFAQSNPEFIWVFLNMDDLRQRRRIQNLEFADMISENAKQLLGTKDKIWVVIDEAQKCPEVFEQVKILYDRFKDQNKIKFILTGSAILSLHQLSAETLAGRIELHHLQEFTLREAASYFEPLVPQLSILDLLNDDPSLIGKAITHLKPFKPILEKQLQEHLLWSGLPEVLTCTTIDEKIIYLNNYIQTYLEKDVRPIDTISDLHLYRNMMEVVAQQTGSVRDDRKLIEALGCTRDTLKKYRGYLASTLLYTDIYPYIDSTIKRLVKSPKGHLKNNGLISVLTGFTQLPLLLNSGLIGHRFETWFLNELTVWLERDQKRSDIHFWRLSTGNEVDFVVDKKPRIFPFEVTFNNKPDSAKLRILSRFLKDEPKASWGYYIYRGDFKIDEHHRICFIPAWAIG